MVDIVGQIKKAIEQAVVGLFAGFFSSIKNAITNFVTKSLATPAGCVGVAGTLWIFRKSRIIKLVILFCVVGAVPVIISTTKQKYNEALATAEKAYGEIKTNIDCARQDFEEALKGRDRVIIINGEDGIFKKIAIQNIKYFAVPIIVGICYYIYLHIVLRYSGRGGAGGNHGFAIPKDSMLFKIKKRNKKSLLKGEDERENGDFNPKMEV